MLTTYRMAFGINFKLEVDYTFNDDQIELESIWVVGYHEQDGTFVKCIVEGNYCELSDADAKTLEQECIEHAIQRAEEYDADYDQ